MNRVIIESPYAAAQGRTVTEHVHYACRAMCHSLDQGEAPFASHLIYPNVLDDSDALQRARGIQAGYEWMQAADIVAFYIDFGWSPGMLKALKVARLYELRIELRSIEGRKLTITPEVQELIEADILEEGQNLMEGVSMFRFKGRPK